MMTLNSLKTLLLACALGVTLTLPLGASVAHAQGEPPPSDQEADEAADSRATGFRAVSGAQVEDVPGGMMLVGAYGAIAVLLLVFLLRQQSQLRELGSRITALRAEIDRKGAEQNQR